MIPTDALLGVYLAFVTVVIIARGGVGAATPWLLAAHAQFALLAFLFTRLDPTSRVGRALHTLYPLALLGGLYAELGVIAQAGSVERIFANDAVVQRWETWLFGTQISYEWIRAAPSVFWSAVLHLAYFSYYPIIVLGPVILFVKGDDAGARRVLFTTMTAFAACYVIFVLFPVAGPNYVWPHPEGAVRDVWSARLIYGILANGSSIGAAFPSSHVAATVAAVLALWRSYRPLALAFAGPVVLLVVGTIYCQMHYGVDVLAGFGIAVAAWGFTWLRDARFLSRDAPLPSPQIAS